MQDNYVPVGLDGILASTERLLATNRGLEEPDQRDALPNDRILMPHDLLRERIKIDAGGKRRQVMRYAARHRSLRGLSPFAFDDYTNGLLIGNPLSQPLEEINPMQVAEQARRITKMGPGGIGDPQAITAGMQAVDESQFGFISPLEGPECFDQESQVFTRRGWVAWPEVGDGDEFACRIDGQLQWHLAERIVREYYEGQLIVGERDTIRMAVTPGHRVINTRDKHYRIDTAKEVFGKSIKIPIRHLPYLGDATMRTFQLPKIPTTNPNQREFGPFDIIDWCAYLGWRLSEGNSHITPVGRLSYETGTVGITQCREANPENYREIRELCLRMGICDCDNGKTFLGRAKQLVSYFQQWDKGCYDKWIPEEFFDAPVEAREALLDALLKGDGRYNEKRWCYCTVSRRLAESVERLAFSLGYTAFIRQEPDSRPEVNTMNWVVSIHRQWHRQLHSQAYLHPSGATYGNYWRIENYQGMVYCATVPGGLLHVRGKVTTSGFWSGNSERAGVDVRMVSGAKYGSDGRIYQRVHDRDLKKVRWVTSEDLRDAIVKIPD